MSSGVAPSAFSTLLRRSKFASYDPAINQVYTSYGGFAHRGHWGIKRDLPVKRKHKVQDPLVSSSGGRGSARRNPVAFISALDSSEGQTEWASAEKDARWLRRLEELGSGTRLNESSAWSKRVGNSGGRAIGNVDSEFGSSESETSQQMSSALPNIQSMSERQFKSYIDKLRSQREQFHAFLQEAGVRSEEGEGRPLAMYAYAQVTSTHHTRFLAHMNHEAATQPTSNTLTPVPHPSGGLDYLNPTHLMSQLLFPNPVKGRYIQPPERNTRTALIQKYDSTAVVSIAGYNAILQPDESSAATQAVNWNKLAERDFSQPPEQASSDYRVETMELYEVPSVVGKSRQGIQGADIKIRVRDYSKRRLERANPHRPGTFEYVSHVDTRTLNANPVSLKGTEKWIPQPSAARPYAEGREEHSTPMMELLDQLLDSPHPGKGKP
ncbi:ribosomal protein subunit protein [Rhizoctonia solani 123E]|uniref:Ribosomal protein subunit protein n=1 Tax=Rhizoctonia solani 123E TaxID=1423351 RepID=A0A074SEJ6_9AGAM|nr:ribosomal protein subunit protein [Rhizoctonia solani 123E]